MAALVSKKNCTSSLWEHFGFQPNEKGEPANLDVAICKICRKSVQVKRGNTTNLRAHLSSYHPSIAARIATQGSGAAHHVGASRQLGVAEAFSRVGKYSRDSDRHKRLTGAVTRYLVEEMVPFSTVQKPSFKSLLEKFDKQYELPGKTYFSETAVPKMYNSVRASVQSELRSVDFFSATTDKCEHDSLHESYCSLPDHRLDSKITLPRNSVYAPESHI